MPRSINGVHIVCEGACSFYIPFTHASLAIITPFPHVSAHQLLNLRTALFIHLTQLDFNSIFQLHRKHLPALC